MKKAILILLLFSLVFISTDLLAQCPMCKTSLEEARKNGSQVGSSLNMGILYLLALPYTVATVFGIIWYKNFRSRKSSI